MNQRKETPFFIGFLGIPAGLRSNGRLWEATRERFASRGLLLAIGAPST